MTTPTPPVDPTQPLPKWTFSVTAIRRYLDPHQEDQ